LLALQRDFLSFKTSSSALELTQPAVQLARGRSPVHSPWVVKLKTHIDLLLRME